MATPKEISDRINGLFTEWSGGFTPLSAAVLDMRREMFIRIFGTGTSGGTNSAGQTLPTKPYTPAYAALKAKNGRPPLELTGFQPTKEEQTAMLQLHADLLVEQISIQISKP